MVEKRDWKMWIKRQCFRSTGTFQKTEVFLHVECDSVPAVAQNAAILSFWDHFFIKKSNMEVIFLKKKSNRKLPASLQDAKHYCST